MTQIKKDLVNWLKQWFPTIDDVDALIGGVQTQIDKFKWTTIAASSASSIAKPYLRLFHMEHTGTSQSGHLIFEMAGRNNDKKYAKIRVDLRRDTTTNSSIKITPLEVMNIDINDFYWGLYYDTSKTYLDIFKKVARYEDLDFRIYDDTTRQGTITQFKPGPNSTESYASVEDAATALYNTAYNSITNGGSYEITANKIIKSGGASSQFLKADGSVDNNTYLTSSNAATATPKVDLYTGAVGTSTKYAKEDHVHTTMNTFVNPGTSSDSYFKIMTIVVGQNYADKPITFTCYGRRAKAHYVELSFVNQGNTDPQVRKFIVIGGDSNMYIAKDGTSTWSIYYKKQENADNVYITDLRYANTFTITYPNTAVASLPSVYLEALYERDNIGVNLLQNTKEFIHTGNTSTATGEIYNGCVVKKFTGNNSSYQDFAWEIPKEWLELGGIYTLSFWAKATETHGYVRTYFYQSNVTSKRLKSNGVLSSTDWNEGAYGDGATQFYINQAWTRYYVTYQLLDTGTFNSNKKIAIRLLSNSTANQNLIIAGVKLEKGDQATKYTESPFDAKLTASQNVVTDANGKIITEAKNNHSHGSLASGGTLNSDITSVSKVAVTNSSNQLKTISKLPFANLNISLSDLTNLGLLASSVSTSTFNQVNQSVFNTNSFIHFYKIGKLVVAYFRVLSSSNLTTSYTNFNDTNTVPSEYRPKKDTISLNHCHFDTATPSILTTRIKTDGSVDMRINTSTRTVDTYFTVVYITN